MYIKDKFFKICQKQHSHKKWKDSLEGSPDQVLFAAELEFPKILVQTSYKYAATLNVPQNQNNCILYVTSFLEQ